MTEKTEPALGHGQRGWKSRQETARRKNIRDPEERARIREARRQHRLETERLAREQAEQDQAAENENQDTGAATEPPADLPEGLTGKGVEIHSPSSGWYQVFVDGISVTEKNVRKAEAEELAETYRNDELDSSEGDESEPSDSDAGSDDGDDSEGEGNTDSDG